MVILSYFLLVPYQTIPDKSLFWIGFGLWALPMMVAIWFVRNKPSTRVNQILGDAIIAEAFGILGMLAAQNRWNILTSISWAAMPGILTGILIGTDTLLISRIFKGQIGPGY
jgi:hypothetical protein